ncbi:MAG: hypothetical protein ACW97G_11640 [Candidatus Thorarchaeota archaeon]
MKANARLFSLILGLIMIFSLLVSPLSSNNLPMTAMDKHATSEMIVNNLMPDPEYSSEPDTHIVGTSGEFSSAFYPDTDENDSYVELIWSHTANTSLDYLGPDPDDTLPDYNDFIYVCQDFEWPYEQRPNLAQVFLNYSVIRTGDFADGVHPGNNLVFRVYVWIIDSSGNWEKVYESRDATYSDELEEKSVELNYFPTVRNIFDGMVEVNGTQEDPHDRATLAIGIAPTRHFDLLFAEHPWMFYNGMVKLRVEHADFYFILDSPTDLSSIWEPKYNHTYTTTIGDVYPHVDRAGDEVWNDCQGMVIGPDNSVYVTGNTISPFDFHEEEGLRYRNQFLLKYSSSLDLLWAVENDNQTQVRSMFFKSGNIYTAGYIVSDDGDWDLIVTKWSTSGARIWQTEWDIDLDQVGVGVGVSSDGSVFVMASDWNFFEPPGYFGSTIVKFDSNGNLLWNKTTEPSTYFNVKGELHVTNEHLYFSNYDIVLCMDHEGTPEWVRPAHALTLDGNGGMYTAIKSAIPPMNLTSELVIAQLDKAGETMWNSIYSVKWPNGWAYELRPVDIAITPSNKILVLVWNDWQILDFTLLSFDVQGNLLESRAIGDETWPYGSSGSVPIEIGTNGLAYFGFSSYVDYYPSVGVQAYTLTGGTASSVLTLPIVIMITSAIVIVGAASAIFVKKRRV